VIREMVRKRRQHLRVTYLCVRGRRRDGVTRDEELGGKVEERVIPKM